MTEDNDALVKKGYEQNADYWIRIVREGRDQYQKAITDPALLAAVPDIRGLEILDAGCGEGYLSRMLIERGARHVYGVDSCLALVTAARTHPAASHDTSTFYHSDVNKLPMPDNSVDIIYANRLPQASAQPERRFHEFARVLRPQGRLVHLSLHPCFYVSRKERENEQRASRPFFARDYFEGRTIVQHFDVDGLRSPAPSVQRFYSLEMHVRLMTQAGFILTDVREPRPDLTDSSWASSFPVPLFLLLICQMSR